jgi:hypothetical protein
MACSRVKFTSSFYLVSNNNNNKTVDRKFVLLFYVLFYILDAIFKIYDS